MADLEFDFSSVHRMAAQYEAAQRIVVAEVRDGIQASVKAIEADAKRFVAKDTQFLMRSIHSEVETHGHDVIGRAGTNELYGLVLEKGRTAGAAMPPMNAAFAGWLRRHGIPIEAQFAVRRSIARRGTRPKPYLKPALDKNRPAITREMAAVLQRISARLASGNG